MAVSKASMSLYLYYKIKKHWTQITNGLNIQEWELTLKKKNKKNVIVIIINIKYLYNFKNLIILK